MGYQNTIKKENELCIIELQDYRHEHLAGKDCGHEDCGKCQLTKQAEISYKDGIKEVITWIKKENPAYPFIMDSGKLELKIYKFQEKLKEWEIDA